MHPNDTVLNELVDETLGRAERADVERHLTTCAECRRTVDELRAVRAQASSLEPMQPPTRVWERIEQDIRRPAAASALRATASLAEAERRREAGRYRRPVTRWRWIAAAAAVLVLAVVAGMRYAPWRRPADTPTTTAGQAELALSVESELLQAEQHYQKAIAGLEQIANAEKGALDPQTAATLEKNLAVIDQAISEGRAALKTQPDSEPAQQSLLESFKTKIAFLQDTISLINEMRKGNDAGAAQIVSGLKKKS